MKIRKKDFLKLLFVSFFIVTSSCTLVEETPNSSGLGILPESIEESSEEESTEEESTEEESAEEESTESGYCGDGNVDSDDGEECDEEGDTALCSDTCLLKTEFVSTWLLSEDDKTITLPLAETDDDGTAFVYDFTVDWGDGTSTDVSTDDFAFADLPVSHTYTFTEAEKEYTLKISGTMETIRFANGTERDKIIAVTNMGGMGWTNFTNAFQGCSKLVEVSGGKTSGVTNMYRMFYNATLVTPNTTNWDTSSVTRMDGMFNSATKANPDTSGWNTSNVTNMAGMFYNATNATPDTSGWNTSNVTNMSGMFWLATNATPNTSGWNTANVTNMESMFTLTNEANPDTSGWNTSKVTKMGHMFRYAYKAEPNTTNWNTSKVTKMNQMFKNAVIANPDTSGWDTSNVTTMGWMFEKAYKANPDVSEWNTDKVTDMRGMFNMATVANPDTSGWSVALAHVQNLFGLSGISDANYSKFLIMAENNYDMTFYQQVKQVSAKYYSGAAAAARQDLIDNHNWYFVDGGETPAPAALVNPSSSSAAWTRPIYQFSGLSADDTVTMYTNDDCTTAVGSATSLGSAVDIQTDELATGSYSFYYQIESGGETSSCSTTTTSYTVEDPIKVFADFNNTCVINTGGDAVCWGDNGDGQLGQENDRADHFGDNNGEAPDNISALPAIELGSDVNVEDVAVGTDHICALLDTAEVKCWGRHNVHSLLGTGAPDPSIPASDTTYIGDEAGEMTNTGSPTYFVEAIDFGTDDSEVALVPEQITAGSSFTCARFTDNSSKCWGAAAHGRTAQDVGGGHGNQFHPIAGVNVIWFGGTGPSNTEVLDISSNYLHSCAVLSGGDVKCWGFGMNGRLGQNDLNITRGTNSYPMTGFDNIDLGVGLTATSVAAGERHSCALLSSGQVKCWGEGADGRLGTGNTSIIGDDETDVADGNLVDLGNGCSNPSYNDDQTACTGANHTWSANTAVQIAAGWSHTCALLKNGTVKCWGLNDFGQLGQNNTSDVITGIDTLSVINLGTAPLRTAISISAGNYHTCAVLDDNTVKCWGKNDYGQLGTQDNTEHGNGIGDDVVDIPALDFSQ